MFRSGKVDRKPLTCHGPSLPDVRSLCAVLPVVSTTESNMPNAMQAAMARANNAVGRSVSELRSSI